MTSPSELKPTHYMFSKEEVIALYELIDYMGWIPRDQPSIIGVVNRISQIVKHDELVTTDNKTT